jgi:hypothetical protein
VSAELDGVHGRKTRRACAWCRLNTIPGAFDFLTHHVMNSPGGY